MSKTFTDENGKQWRHCGGAAPYYVIEPIPAPPQTEAEILAEMDREIVIAWENVSGMPAVLKQTARAIVAAVQKLREVGK